MLVLTRRDVDGQRDIRIGDEIIVRIVDIRGNKVRIGVIAPENVPCHREEVWRVIHESKRKGWKNRGAKE